MRGLLALAVLFCFALSEPANAMSCSPVRARVFFRCEAGACAPLFVSREEMHPIGQCARSPVVEDLRPNWREGASSLVTAEMRSVSEPSVFMVEEVQGCFTEVSPGHPCKGAVVRVLRSTAPDAIGALRQDEERASRGRSFELWRQHTFRVLINLLIASALLAGLRFVVRPWKAWVLTAPVVLLVFVQGLGSRMFHAHAAIEYSYHFIALGCVLGAIWVQKRRKRTSRYSAP